MLEAGAGVAAKILQNKVAIVTGGGRGVGQGIAFALAAAGAQLVLLGRNAVALDDSCSEIHRRGGDASAIVCDVTDPNDIQRAVDDIVNDYDGVDILINAAHSACLGALLELSDDDVLLGFDSGPVAALRFMRACHPYLCGDGVIINLASGLALRPDSTGFGAFAAAKEAIRSLSRAAACEWGGDNIRVNCLMPLANSPGLTAMLDVGGASLGELLGDIPLGRLGDAERDIGRAVVFLCSADAAFITGQTLAVDGGQALLR